MSDDATSDGAMSDGAMSCRNTGTGADAPQRNDLQLGPLASGEPRSRIMGVSQTQPTWSTRSRIAFQALRFGRSLIVGCGGTARDLAVLTLSIRVFGLGPTWGRAIGLLVGGVVLFLGSRSFAFRAESESAVAQARRFVISELIAFPLNISTFKLLIWLLPQVAPELLGLLANFVLFVTYYYPVRNWLVFNTKQALVAQPAT